MKNQIQYIVDETTRPVERPLVILMTSTHPMTDSYLCRTGHQFYNLDLPNFPIKWEKNRPVPENMHFITDPAQLPHRPDLILCQNVVDQLPVMQQLAYMFDCPIIEFEHTLPAPDWEQLGVIDQMLNQVDVTAYAFITDYSRQAWKRGDDPSAFVQYHMVDTDFYKGWRGGNGKAAIMCNSFQGREWAVGDVKEYMLACEEIVLFGINPGYESFFLPNPEAVVDTLSQFDVFVNTSVRSPIPASVLEAAAIGMPIVSTKTCAIPEFFTEGVNIRFCEGPEDCAEIVKELLEDKEQRKRLGAAARQVVEEHFNEERYVSDWNELLSYALENYHNE